MKKLRTIVLTCLTAALIAGTAVLISGRTLDTALLVTIAFGFASLTGVLLGRRSVK